MVRTGSHAGCRNDVGRLQEEGNAAAPTPTAPTAGANRFDFGKSQYHSGRTIGVSDLADQQRHRRVDRWHWRAVQANGSQSVSPTDSTTYHLTAKGSGGSQEATARLTVTQAPTPPPPTPSVSDEDLFSQNVKDVYFDYDKADVRGDQQSSVQADAQFLNQHPNINITIEGHCDERGSTDYNLALGDQRASAVKAALTGAGTNASRIKTISYGKEKPFCTESNEACWQQNRRGHLTYQK